MPSESPITQSIGFTRSSSFSRAYDHAMWLDPFSIDCRKTKSKASTAPITDQQENTFNQPEAKVIRNWFYFEEETNQSASKRHLACVRDFGFASAPDWPRMS